MLPSRADHYVSHVSEYAALSALSRPFIRLAAVALYPPQLAVRCKLRGSERFARVITQSHLGFGVALTLIELRLCLTRVSIAG